MADKSQQPLSGVKLREKVEQSRHQLARDAEGLQYELDFKRKFRRAFRHNTALWIGSALAIGLLLALMRARTKKIYVGRGGKKLEKEKRLLESASLLRLGLSLAQPLLVSYLTKKVRRA